MEKISAFLSTKNTQVYPQTYTHIHKAYAYLLVFSNFQNLGISRVSGIDYAYLLVVLRILTRSFYAYLLVSIPSKARASKGYSVPTYNLHITLTYNVYI